jgi:dihydrofolate reductase
MHVFLIAAISIDGFIAPEVSTNSTEWTSGADKEFFTQRSKQAGVMVMGSTTFETIGRPMKDRLTVVISSKPKPEKYAHIDDSQVRYTSQSPTEIVKQLELEGFKEIALCGGSSIYTQFMNAGLVNSLYITVEPIIFGGGVSLFNKTLDQQKLKLIKSEKIGEDTMLLEYTV